MISTRFLPMSWTSPFTVASTITPRVADSAFSMWGSRWETAAFIASADWSTSATMSWLSLKSRPTSSMPRIRAVIAEDAVEHLAPRRGQPERDVGDAEDRLALREAGLDRPQTLDRLDRRADVVRVAGADGEDERIEDQVARGDPVLAREQLVRALGDRELALPRD